MKNLELNFRIFFKLEKPILKLKSSPFFKNKNYGIKKSNKKFLNKTFKFFQNKNKE